MVLNVKIKYQRMSSFFFSNIFDNDVQERRHKEEEVPLGCARMLPFYHRAANRLVIFATWAQFNENKRNVKICYTKMLFNLERTLFELKMY
jgi:hypothetical protein